MWIIAGIAQMVYFILGCGFWLFVLWLMCRPGMPRTAEIREPLRIPEEFDRLFGGYCVKCGSAEDGQWDHVVPRSLGGSDHIANLQRLCGRCNREKAATYADYRSDQQKEWVQGH